MREITVATVQMKPELGSTENNLVKMSDFISTITSQQKVDLIVFPELITSGYELGVQFTELAQRVPGPAVNLMAQRAADTGVYIAFGLATKEKVESILYNSAVLIGPEGELLGHYNKLHLRGEERMAFREGFKIPVFDAGELGKIGLMLGWDLAYPEVARAQALEGAELICCLANWESNAIDEWKTYVRARAYENSLFVAGANRVGEDVTMKFGGESMIVSPRGRVLAALETDAELRKEIQREQDEMRREIAALKESKASLEAAAEARREADKKAKETEAAKKDGVILKEEGEKSEKSEKQTEAQKPEANADGKGETAEKKADTPKVLAMDKPHREHSETVRKGGADKKSHEAAEGYCVARIDLDEVRRYREEYQTLQTRQPTAYKVIVRRY